MTIVGLPLRITHLIFFLFFDRWMVFFFLCVGLCVGIDQIRWLMPEKVQLGDFPWNSFFRDGIFA